MAREVRKFSVTVPAGTPQLTPQVSSLKFPDRTVLWVEVVIPPGPHGLVGFQLTSGGSQIIPSESGAFFVSDGEKIHWDLTGQIDTGAWQLTAYNTGSFPHTLEIRFGVDVVARPAPGPGPLLIESSALSS